MNAVSGFVREARPENPRYLRVTPVGDGRYDVSTVSAGPYNEHPETCIFDNETGDSWVVEHHADAGDSALDVDHMTALKQFALGEYASLMQDRIE